jgi:hypothetical protein
MRCRSGLMALSVMRDAPVLMEVANPSSQDRTPRGAIVFVGPAAAVPYRASGLVHWHKADVSGPANDFCSLRQSRHDRFCTASEKAGIRRRVRIQNAQLTAAKVSNPGFRGKARNSPDISKGISQSGMCKFESSDVSQAVSQLEIVHS